MVRAKKHLLHYEVAPVAAIDSAQEDDEFELTQHKTGWRSASVVLPLTLLAVGVVVAYGSGAISTKSTQRNIGDFSAVLQAVELRVQSSACFEPRTKYLPDMAGMGRQEFSTVEECQAKCRSVAGCSHISYWADGGCHLAGATAKRFSDDNEGMSGPPTCKGDECFSHGVEYDPLSMAGRGRTNQNSAADCQAHCHSIPGCATFSWWPDGGCHVQDGNAKAKSSSSQIVTGPAQCPLITSTVTTTTTEPTTTVSTTTETQTATETTTKTTVTATETTTTISTTTKTISTTTAETTETSTSEGTVAAPVSSSNATETVSGTTTPSTSVAMTETVTETATSTSMTSTFTSTPDAAGCEEGVKLLLTSHRKEQLKDHEGDLRTDANTQAWEQWVLNSTGDAGMTEYTITSHRGERLEDADGDLRLSSDEVAAPQKWNLTDAGDGQVFIRSHRGQFLHDNHGHLRLAPNADNWEKWNITTLSGKRACTFHRVSFFCFTVMRSWGHELALMKQQRNKSVGIFGCDEAMVLSEKEVVLSDEPLQTTVVISHHLMSKGAGLFENHELFLMVWKQVERDGRWSTSDWTLKIDPDAVFLPQRLRVRLGGGSHSRTHATFYANCAGRTDIQIQDRDQFMYGPIELFSQAAVKTLFGGLGRCRQELKEGEMRWEERFITKCLEKLGVPLNPYMNLNLLSDPHCSDGGSENKTPACSSNAVCFHQLKTPEDYLTCLETSHHGEVGDD